MLWLLCATPVSQTHHGLSSKWSVVGVSVGVCCRHYKSDPGDKSDPTSSISFAKILWHFTETTVNCCFEKLFGVPNYGF